MTKLAAWYPLHKDTNDWSGNEKHLILKNPDSPNSIERHAGILGKCYGKSLKSKLENLVSPPMGLIGDVAMFTFINVSDLGADTSANGVVTNHDHGRHTGMGITLKGHSSSSFKASVNTGDGRERTYHSYFGSTVMGFNKWHHIGFTWEQKTRTLCIYVNGSLDYKSVGQIPTMLNDPNSPVALFRWSLPYTTPNYQPAMKLQDVRIYNEIPSLREINWIAKACMLHWNFNEQAYGSLVPITAWEGYEDYHTVNETTGSYIKLTMKAKTIVALRPVDFNLHNKRFRISGNVFINGEPLNVTNITSRDMDAPIRTEAKSGWFISDILSATSNYIIHENDGLGSPNAGDVVEFKNLRVELLQSDNGNDGSIRDVTGLKHDGLATADLPMYSREDSNLGNGCYYFENNSIYSKEKLSVGGSNAITMATWFKSSSVGNDNYHVLMAILSTNYELTINSIGQLRFGFIVNGERKVSNFGDGLLDGQWHHVASTFDGEIIKAYVDGVKVGSIEAVGNLTVLEKELSVGQMFKPKGTYSSNKLYQSDVMIFGTAFTQEEIKKLARQRLTVDKKAQVHAVEFVESTGHTRVSGRGQLVSPNLYEHNFKPSIVDYSTWIIGNSSADAFGRNGATYENEILVDKNPHGVNDVVWRAKQETTTSDSDGGFNGRAYDIDNTKTYRFSCWINRKVMGNGSFYFGTHGYNAGGEVALENMSGSLNSNPYFVTGTPHKENEWFLIVGYVYPAGTTEKLFNDDGAFTKDGNKVRSVDAFKWAADAVKSHVRAYLYYSTNTSTQQNFYRPRMEMMDGTQPTIQDLLKCKEHTPIYPFYNTNGIYQSNKFGLGKHVVAKEFIEI